MYISVCVSDKISGRGVEVGFTFPSLRLISDPLLIFNHNFDVNCPTIKVARTLNVCIYNVGLGLALALSYTDMLGL